MEWWGSRPFTAGVEDNRRGVYGQNLVALTIESAAMSKMLLASISRGMLSKIENGQTSASLSTLTKVARALARHSSIVEGQSIRYIVQGDGFRLAPSYGLHGKAPRARRKVK